MSQEIKYIPNSDGSNTDWVFGESVKFPALLDAKVVGYTYERGKYDREGLKIVVSHEGATYICDPKEIVRKEK